MVSAQGSRPVGYSPLDSERGRRWGRSPRDTLCLRFTAGHFVVKDGKREPHLEARRFLNHTKARRQKTEDNYHLHSQSFESEYLQVHGK